MALAAGALFTFGFSRQVLQVIGIYAPLDSDINHAWRAWTLGAQTSQVFVLDSDETAFIVFVVTPAAPPAGAPPIGSLVNVQTSPVAYYTGSPVSAFPLTIHSIPEGIVNGYATFAVFPGITYALVTDPSGNIFVASIDELTAGR